MIHTWSIRLYSLAISLLWILIISVIHSKELKTPDWIFEGEKRDYSSVSVSTIAKFHFRTRTCSTLKMVSIFQDTIRSISSTVCRGTRSKLPLYISFRFDSQTRRSAYPAKRGKPRVAQEGQQVAERALPSKRGHGPIPILLQSQINRPRGSLRCRSRHDGCSR